jgi:argininosuccinate lyase
VLLSDPEAVPESGIGRLASPPDPLLFALLYREQFHRDAKEVLPWLLRVDAAHVLMLAERGILLPEVAASLLRLNRDLSARVRHGEVVLPAPASHRGLYFVYERYFIDHLGGDVGGAAHVARSRNDINAAITRLRLRQELLALLDDGGELLRVALALAGDHSATVMSGFSHFQPAQPATFGHYLGAVTCELARSLALLSASWAVVNRSPMGAGAGLGTSFAIDPARTAALLGFEGAAGNSLDAVASRDYAVHVISPLALLGTTLTRLALDLQMWSSRAYQFLGWPDPLVSTSSMMPQKRNAFVLENIRGQAAVLTGALTSTLAGLKNTPYSNTVEVSSEATSHLWPAVAAAGTAIRLTTLMLRHILVDGERMRTFLDQEETTMTAVADHLVACHGLSFRVAHEVVGRLLRENPPPVSWSPGRVKAGLEAILASEAGHAVALDESELGQALDPVACACAARHGGGPAPEGVRDQLARLEAERCDLAERTASRRRRVEEAAAGLAQAVEALLKI